MATIKGITDLAGAAASSLLCDPVVENQEAPQTDRLSNVSAPNVTLVTQADVSVTDLSCKPSPQTFVNTALDGGNVNPKRFVPLIYSEWSMSAGMFGTLGAAKLPKDMTLQRYPLGRIAAQFQALRTGWEFNLVVNTNPGFRGGLVMYYLPAGARPSVNCYMNYPHAVVNASTNTSCLLKIPYVCDSPYVMKDSEELGEIRVSVLSPLYAPSGASTSVEFTVYARADNPEFIGLSLLEGPKKRSRKKVGRRMTSEGKTQLVRVDDGQGFCFMASYNHTKYRPAMSLGGEETSFQIASGGSNPIKDLMDVCKIPTLQFNCTWRAAQNQGDVIAVIDVYCARQISATLATSNLDFIGSMFKYFSGSVNYTFQVFASKFTQGRMICAFLPNAEDEMATLPQTVTLNQTANLYTSVFDLGLNSTFTFTIPFICTRAMRRTEALVGRLYLLVLNRLTFNAASPQSAEVMIYKSAGPDMRLYVPVFSNMKTVKQGDSDFEDNPFDTEWDSSDDETGVLDTVGSIENSSGAYVTGQTFENLHMKTPNIFPFSHTDVKMLLGRSAYAGSHTINAETRLVYIAPVEGQAMALMQDMFLYNTGDLTLTICPRNNGSFQVAAMRGKASFDHDVDFENTPESHPELFTPDGIVSGFGGRPVTMRVPYYNNIPLQKNSQKWMLRLKMSASEQNSVFDIFIAATKSTKWYFLQAPTNQNTLKQDPNEMDSDDEGATGFSLLKLCGDVEENPGPLYYKHGEKKFIKMKGVHRYEEYFDVLYEGMVIRIQRDGDAMIAMDLEVDIDKFRDQASVVDFDFQDMIYLKSLEILCPVNCSRTRKIIQRFGSTVSMKFFACVFFFLKEQVIKTFSDHQLLLLCGDIETNPGPMIVKERMEEGKLIVEISHCGKDMSISTDNTYWYVMNERFPKTWKNDAHLINIDENLYDFVMNNVDEFSDPILCDVDLNFPYTEKFYVVLTICISNFFDEKQASWKTKFLSFFTGISPQTIEEAQVLDSMFSVSGISHIIQKFTDVSGFKVIKPILKLICYVLALTQSGSTSGTAAILGCMTMDGVDTLLDFKEMIRNVFKTRTTEERFRDFLETHASQCEAFMYQRMKKAYEAENSTGIFDFDENWWNPLKKQGGKELVQFTSTFKSFTFWLDMMRDLFLWIKGIFSPDRVQKAKVWMTQNKAKLDGLIQHADFQVWKRNKGTDTKEDKVMVVSIADEMYEVLRDLTPIKGTPEYRVIESTFHRLVPFVREARTPKSVRCEPVAFHFEGNPGCGKSLLCMRLCKAIAKSIGSNVYTYPYGSKYFDSYTDQEVVYIDDFLQSSSEEDVGILCQLLGGGEVKLPMADLNEKGRTFKGRVLLASGNCPPKPVIAVKTPDAIRRRFDCFYLRAKKEYIKKGAVDTFDIGKAQEDKTYETGSCWEIKYPGSTRFVDVNVGALLVFMMARLNEKEDKFAKMEDTTVPDLDLYKKMMEKNESSNNTLSGNLKKKQGIEEDEEEIIRRAIDEDTDDDDFTDDKDDEIPVYSYSNPNAYSIPKTPVYRRRYMDDFLNSDFDPNWVRQQIGLEPEKHEEPDPFETKMERNSFVYQAPNDPQYKKDRLWKVDREVDKLGGVLKLLAILAGVVSAISLVSSAIGLIRNFAWLTRTIKNWWYKAKEPERPYNPAAAAVKAKEVVARSYKEGYNDYVHLTGNLVTVSWLGGCANGFALGGSDFLCYTHAGIGGDIEILGPLGVIRVDESDYKLEELYIDGIHTEAMLLRVMCNMNFTYRQMWQHLADPEEGRNARRLERSTGVVLSVEVTQCKRVGMTYTVDGDSFCNTSEWFGDSGQGCCGGIYIQKQKGAWKIVGIHVAGKYKVCTSVDLGKFSCMKEGVVVLKTPANAVFSPCKSQLKKSPLYGMVEPKWAPAALSPRDKRLNVEVENLVKFASEKHVGNIFNVDHTCMQMIFDFWTEKWKKLGFTKFRECSVKDAITGLGNNKIDTSTSAGLKYSSIGKKKTDLFNFHPDGNVWVDPEFELDVTTQFFETKSGVTPQTTFCTYLKDELRPIEKVALAKTRAIEACSVDYTVLYRMFCGQLYNHIYSAHPIYSGVGVGMSPLTDSEEMLRVMSMFQCYVTADFTKFDGSLSKPLLQTAADFLAQWCEDQEAVVRLHEPIIDKQVHVFDELWSVEGSMASGSPATSVLNSICNMFVCTYAFYQCGGDLGSMEITTYGDDVVMMHNCPDIKIGDNFSRCIKECFGMTATDTSKKGENFNVRFEEVSFLKRSFSQHEEFGLLLALDKEMILQSLMWCRGNEEFEQKLVGLCVELAAHGRETYETCKAVMESVLDRTPYIVPTYRTSKNRLRGILGIHWKRRVEYRMI